MKKVFFINCADFGSTGKIIKDTAKVLREKGWRSILCVPKITQKSDIYDKAYGVSLKYEQGLYNRIGKITGNKYGIAPLSSHKVITALKNEKPDLVHIHCANGCFVNIYRLLDYLRRKKIPTVITNHAEFYYTGGCDHAYECDKWLDGCGKCPQRNSLIDGSRFIWKKMKKTVSKFDRLVVTSVSPWVLSRSEVSPIFNFNGIEQVVVENGVDTDIFNYFGPDEKILSELGINKKTKIILHVTAHFYGDSEKKGGKYVIELAKRLEGEDVIIIVAGAYDENIYLPKNVKMLGKVADQKKLAQLYSLADVCIVTGKRETFNMPVAEALCCGTPVIGFKAGGPESIAIDEFCEFFDYGNVDMMYQSIIDKWLEFKDNNGAVNISKKACEKFSKEIMGEKYLKIYENAINSLEAPYAEKK